MNYNCHSTLKACLGSILRSRGVGEVILVDNASKDESMNLIKEIIDKRLNIIRLKRNIGLAAARNLAAERAHYGILAITDADIAVDPQWLDYPCLLLERHREFGAVQCNIVRSKNINKIALSFMASTDSHLKDFSIERQASFYNCLFPVGAAFVIRQDVWTIVNGFDSLFFIGNDDVDFGIRLWTSGYEVVCSYEGTVYHKFGTLRSQKRISPIFQFCGLRNMLFIWTKDLQWITIVKHVLPFTIFYPFMAIRYGGVEGIKGLISFFKNLSLIMDKRFKVQRLRKRSDNQIIQMMHETGTLPIDLIINDFRLLINFFKRYKK